jgi:hypothetical protein
MPSSSSPPTRLATSPAPASRSTPANLSSDSGRVRPNPVMDTGSPESGRLGSGLGNSQRRRRRAAARLSNDIRQERGSECRGSSRGKGRLRRRGRPRSGPQPTGPSGLRCTRKERSRWIRSILRSWWWVRGRQA